MRHYVISRIENSTELEKCYDIFYFERDICSTSSSIGIVQAVFPRWAIIYGPNARDWHIEKDRYPEGCRQILGKKTPQDEVDEIIENIYEQRRNNRKIEESRN